MRILLRPLPLLLLYCLSCSFICAELHPKVGINYGQLGNDLPSPSKSIQLIKKLKAGRVKIYDANPKILKALQNTDLQVSIMLPNQIIPNVSSNQSFSDDWVKSNVLPFYPRTLIRYLLVGNEILSHRELQNSTWPYLVPAMRRIKHSLKVFNVSKVKVGTTLAMDVLESSYPPSNGTFRSDIAGPIMKPMLQFLNWTKSFLFLDVYPYFPWSQQYKSISLDYALFQGGNITVSDPGSGLTYTNLFDQMVDAVYSAMTRLGYKNVRIWIAETGWPNGGNVDEIGASAYNAAIYNRNLVKRLTAKPPIGTPARPGVVLPTFLFSLYNENQKDGLGTERHWGLLYPNGSEVYEIDLAGKMPKSGYRPLPLPDNNEPYKGRIWCVVAEGANKTELGSALAYACGQGNRTCEPIRKGGKCYKPGSLIRHASYAFSSYWSQFRSAGGSCYFNGLAIQTTIDPSYGSCKFPSVTLQS